MSAATICNLGTGKMSVFGGPGDDGVGPHEGLALIGPADLALPWFARLFLSASPEGTTGLARRLNPSAFYLAMCWDYSRFGKDELRRSVVRLTNPKTGACVFVQPADFGPGNGQVVDGVQTEDTGRLADLSPAAASALGLQTNDLVTCELILPEVES